MKVFSDCVLDVDAVPQSILPSDYGGDAESVQEITGENFDLPIKALRYIYNLQKSGKERWKVTEIGFWKMRNMVLLTKTDKGN